MASQGRGAGHVDIRGRGDSKHQLPGQVCLECKRTAGGPCGRSGVSNEGTAATRPCRALQPTELALGDIRGSHREVTHFRLGLKRRRLLAVSPCVPRRK